MEEKNTINFAIDLGTTNSVIAKNEKGEVILFKNPVGQKETLPSVVAFRNGRIIVGDKAREYLEKDSSNVVGLFKRKMGTDHLFDIKSLDKKVSPVELSSFVLKEIKNFVTTGEQVSSVVITIPASFDTVQSNATKEAGNLAGFEEVYLLQEPIAAALAYTNQFANEEENKKWIVYDLGGGTFDVALIELADGELKIIDHKGDNFMGGLDFDNLIFEELVIPHLKTLGNFPDNLIQDFKSASGKFHSKYYQIIKKCEDLKVTLSTNEIGEIEFEIEDLDGELIDVYLEINRAQFNTVIRPVVDASIRFVQDLVAENHISSSEVESILLVGGSTFIPLVRDLLAETLSIPVDTRIDPISAVAAGASYFASTKKKKEGKGEEKTAQKSDKISIKTAYQKQTQLNSEYFVAQITGDTSKLFYRVIRKDGGFDSGLKSLAPRIEENLTLIANANNAFELKIFDATQNLICSEYLEINQGKYGVLGQPLPEDICLEIDDIEDNSTGLQLIFKKNELLPLKKMVVKEVTKTISKGSDTSIVINVLEGPQQASPTSNKPIGVIEIKGKDLEKDLIRGTDVEILIEITESRDLKIKTYFSQIDQEFEEVFSSSKRYVNVNSLKTEVFDLLSRILDLKDIAETSEDFLRASQLKELEQEARKIYDKVSNISEDDVTDSKFQIEDSKRQISYKLDSLDSTNKLEEMVSELMGWESNVAYAINSKGEAIRADYKSEYEKLSLKTKAAVQSNNKIQLRTTTEALRNLFHKLQIDDPSYLISLFRYWAYTATGHTNERRKNKLIEDGESSIDKQNYIVLKSIINELYSLIPEEKKNDEISGKNTGIS